MRLSALLLAATAAVVIAGPAYPRMTGPIGQTCNGTVQGVHSSVYNQDYFLSIPYAQPPVGDLRFQRPQSLNTKWTTPLDGSQYPNACIGYGPDSIGQAVSEDCLYLNVIRPSGYENQALPVAVWIYGGGFSEGATSDPRYNVSYFVQNSVSIGKPVIAVTLQYRLSAWGFLTSEEVSEAGVANLGLRDQRKALEWIQENIGGFGGDPRKVTIWGESAGAMSVGLHMMAFGGRDDQLFRGAVMESGGPINYMNFKNESYFQDTYNTIVLAVGCGLAADTLACLRAAPFLALNTAFLAVAGATLIYWQPIIDGDFISQPTSQLLAAGKFTKVPIIIGTNTDEGTVFSPFPLFTSDDFERALYTPRLTFNMPESMAPSAAVAYQNNDAEYRIPSDEATGNFTPPAFGTDQFRRMAAYMGDALFISNRRTVSQTWAENGLDAYSYRFDTLPAVTLPIIGVTHYCEVAFVFGSTAGRGYNINPFLGEPQGYYDVSRLMMSSWASFMHDQDPNSFRNSSETNSEAWAPYSIDSPQNMVWEGASDGKVAYMEPDTFRKAGMQWIKENNVAAYNR